jgi:hypothetical protein
MPVGVDSKAAFTPKNEVQVQIRAALGEWFGLKLDLTTLFAEEEASMSTTTVHRSVQASVESVFQTVADIQNFSKAVPDILGVEFLSDVKSGLGARFKETRLMGKRRASTVLEVTEYLDNDRIRYVSDAGGTIWDTVISVKSGDGATDLSMVMEAKPYRFLAKDMDAVKAYCVG